MTWNQMTTPENVETETEAPAHVRPGSFVAQTHVHPEYGSRRRHGFVTEVHDPAVVGTNDDGTDKTSAHASVAWLGLDGLTTVPVDELDSID